MQALQMVEYFEAVRKSSNIADSFEIGLIQSIIVNLIRFLSNINAVGFYWITREIGIDSQFAQVNH